MAEFETTKQTTLPATDAARQLAELKAKKLRQQQQADENALAILPERLSLCIDASGSMNTGMASELPYSNGYNTQRPDYTSRLDAAISAYRRQLAASDPKTTSYSLVQFGSHARLVVPTTTNYTLIQTAKVEDGGGTDLEGGLFVSLKQTPTRIILLSDGDIYYRPEAAVAEAVTKGVKIDAIAIGEANDSMMMWIAEATGGTFKRCKTVAELTEHFLMLEPRNYLQLEHKVTTA